MGLTPFKMLHHVTFCVTTFLMYFWFTFLMKNMVKIFSLFKCYN